MSIFQGIDIRFSGPICQCEEKNLGLNIGTYGAAGIMLQVFCKTCGTMISISRSMLNASIILASPYPGKKKTPQPTKHLALAKKETRGKVIPLFKTAPVSSDNSETNN